MKWQLLGPWPIGAGSEIVPAGTIIELRADGSAPTSPHGNRIPLPLPLNARCLDQAAYDQMIAWYTPLLDDFAHLIHYSPGIQHL
jgi:hypothetical protein